MRLARRRVLTALEGGVLDVMPEAAAGVESSRPIRATRGHFDQERWRPASAVAVEHAGGRSRITVREPTVMVLDY